MNSLTKVETNNQLAPIGLTDPFEAFADRVAPRYIIGDLLRFSKGDYLAGESGRNVPAGSIFTAAVEELMAGWVKWSDSKPAEHIMVRVADGAPLPKRNELGDNDETKWETDANGNPRDPWQFTNYLPMMNEAGELFTFTTSSHGGINAIGILARRYGNHRKRHPNLLPLIALGVGSYAHKNRDYGRIKFPQLTPAGWVPNAKFLEALAAAGIIAADPAHVERDPGDEIDDTVPI
jgi:hypothetical protein